MVAGPPMVGMVYVDFWVFGLDLHFGGSMAPKPKKRTFAEFRMAALTSGTNASSVAASFLSGAVDETNDEDGDEWVSLHGTKDDTVFKPKADKGKTSKPFLFNCASGLVPPTKIKGQKESRPTSRRVPRIPRVPRVLNEENNDTWLVQSGGPFPSPP